MPAPILLDSSAPLAALFSLRPDLSERAIARAVEVGQQAIRDARAGGDACKVATLARYAGALMPGYRLEIRLVQEK